MILRALIIPLVATLFSVADADYSAGPDVYKKVCKNQDQYDGNGVPPTENPNKATCNVIIPYLMTKGDLPSSLEGPNACSTDNWHTHFLWAAQTGCCKDKLVRDGCDTQAGYHVHDSVCKNPSTYRGHYVIDTDDNPTKRTCDILVPYFQGASVDLLPKDLTKCGTSKPHAEHFYWLATMGCCSDLQSRCPRPSYSDLCIDQNKYQGKARYTGANNDGKSNCDEVMFHVMSKLKTLPHTLDRAAVCSVSDQKLVADALAAGGCCSDGASLCYGYVSTAPANPPASSSAQARTESQIATSDGDSASSGSSPVGAIVGGVVAIVAIAAIAFVVLNINKQKARQSDTVVGPNAVVVGQVVQSNPTVVQGTPSQQPLKL